MKHVNAALCSVALSFASTAVAGTKEISEAVDKLQPYVYELTESKIKGDSVEEMLEDLALRVHGAEDFQLVNYPETGIPSPDDAVDQYGLTKMSDVADLVNSNFEEYYVELKPALAKQAKEKVWAAIKEAKAAGALFGYAGHGGVICGVTFPSPLIIDKAAKKVYELVLVGGGC